MPKDRHWSLVTWLRTRNGTIRASWVCHRGHPGPCRFYLVTFVEARHSWRTGSIRRMAAAALGFRQLSATGRWLYLRAAVNWPFRQNDGVPPLIWSWSNVPLRRQGRCVLGSSQSRSIQKTFGCRGCRRFYLTCFSFFVLSYFWFHTEIREKDNNQVKRGTFSFFSH